MLRSIRTRNLDLSFAVKPVCLSLGLRDTLAQKRGDRPCTAQRVIRSHNHPSRVTGTNPHEAGGRLAGFRIPNSGFQRGGLR
jgi:hypothetical protein